MRPCLMVFLDEDIIRGEEEEEKTGKYKREN